MRYMLITVRDWHRVNITTEICETKELAYARMKSALAKALEDKDNTYINLLESGVELSNGGLCEDSAWAVMEYGDDKYNWKIVEV